MKCAFTLRSNELNKEDLRALLQAVRDCEMANFPKKAISIVINVPELKTKDCKDVLKSIKPPYEVGPVVMKL